MAAALSIDTTTRKSPIQPASATTERWHCPLGNHEHQEPAMAEDRNKCAVDDHPPDVVGQRLWLYNYDFEFELAALPSVTGIGPSSFPWFHLNRSAAVLLPLTRPGDRLVVYEPAAEIEVELKQRLGFLPDYLKLSPNSESNAVLDDLSALFRSTDPVCRGELTPWGWSPNAYALSRQWGLGGQQAPREDRVGVLNSKRTSHYWRETLLPSEWRIPSVFLERSGTTPAVLSEQLASFFRSAADGYVKHPFGTSGRLSERCSAGSFSRRQLRRWFSWTISGGGVLLEKALPVTREWSLQVEFDPQGTCRPVALTRMLTGQAGQYLGNVIRDSDQAEKQPIFEQLKPILVEMVRQGYIGPAGFDLIETDDGRLRLLEVNARLTMGRIAAAWFLALGSPPAGLFIHRFLGTTKPPRPDQMLTVAGRTAARTGCPITLISFVAPPTARRCLLSLFIAGPSETELRQTWRQLITEARFETTADLPATGGSPP